MRAQQPADGTEHLANEFFGFRRSGQNIQALRQRVHLSARDLLGSPELLFRPLALGNLFFQLLVGSQKLAGSLRDALIELLCDPLLLAQESCLLQSDHCLVRR